MASMTKLRRRFLSKSGYWRSLRAMKEEQIRREVRTVYWPTDDPYDGYGPCFCLGCIGSGRCEHEDRDEDELP